MITTILLFMFGAIYGQTRFSHMTTKDFSDSHGLKLPNYYYRRYIPPIYNQTTTNMSIDWRNKGVVTPVRDQGLCGSCWAFSAAETIESQLAIATDGLEELSVQELVDCVSKDDHCMGGWPTDAFEWVKKYGITTESEYNYTAFDGQCRNSSVYPIANVTKVVYLPNDEAQMLEYMRRNGPISVTVDATSFQNYISGIVDDCISNRVDHAVVIVGYEPAGAGTYPAYWIVRNSWSTTFGEDGYIRIKYGDNQCMITSNPSSVEIY